MMESIYGITYFEQFIENPSLLFDQLASDVLWDERMSSRKTASYGKAYNYSQIHYPDQPFTSALTSIAKRIKNVIGFLPNNCLINYYLDGTSRMGFHADQTDILVDGTGVVIVSIGATRTLRFRNLQDRSLTHDYALASGSCIFMSNEVQEKWQHAIPTSSTTQGRMSLTFRKIKE